MSLISITFFIFYLILFILYYTLLKDKQWLLLLTGSLVFYAFASPVYLIFLLISAVSTYLAGRFVGNGRIAQSYKNAVLIAALVLNIGILAVLKYSGMITGKSLILPLGISYYTFVVVAYLVDVSRGVAEAEPNYLKYLLFVSYFPQITQGPINRYNDLAPQFYTRKSIDTARIEKGIFRIVTGLFKKLVIAERLSVYVDRVYGNYASYDGLTFILATFFYSIQIYCDFSGYMDMVLGLSSMLGIDMEENFNLPYFAKSIAEFWRRWHITLGSWFREYLYYPVLRSAVFKKLNRALKKGKIKFSKNFIKTFPTVLALLITWAATGIWHGSSWHYGAWGLYHGILIILSMIFAKTFAKMNAAFKITDTSKGFNIFRIVRTFILVNIGYVFFRAPGMGDAFAILKNMIVKFSLNKSAIANALLPFTEDNTAVSYFLVVFAAIVLLFVWELVMYTRLDDEDNLPTKAVEVSRDLNESAVRETENTNHECIIQNHGSLTNSSYVLMGIMLIAILLFGVFGQSSFIYMMY